MTILILLLFYPFVARTENLRSREHNLIALETSLILSVNTVFQPPQLNDPVVGWQHLQLRVMRLTQEFEWIDFLVQLETLQMIKFGLMALDLRKVPIIEIARILQISVAENNHSSAFVSNCQVFSCFVKIDRSQDIGVRHTGWVSFSQPVNIYPVEFGGCLGRHLLLRRRFIKSFRFTNRNTGNAACVRLLNAWNILALFFVGLANITARTWGSWRVDGAMKLFEFTRWQVFRS